MLALGRERDEVSVVDDQRGSPTYVGHLAAAVSELMDLPPGIWHVAAEGDCTWAEFAEAIFEEADIDCRVQENHDCGVRAARAAPGVFGAAQRAARRARAAALARRPTRLPRPAALRARRRRTPSHCLRVGIELVQVVRVVEAERPDDQPLRLDRQSDGGH